MGGGGDGGDTFLLDNYCNMYLLCRTMSTSPRGRCPSRIDTGRTVCQGHCRTLAFIVTAALVVGLANVVGVIALAAAAAGGGGGGATGGDNGAFLFVLVERLLVLAVVVVRTIRILCFGCGSHFFIALIVWGGCFGLGIDFISTSDNRSLFLFVVDVLDGCRIGQLKTTLVTSTARCRRRRSSSSSRNNKGTLIMVFVFLFTRGTMLMITSKSIASHGLKEGETIRRNTFVFVFGTIVGNPLSEGTVRRSFLLGNTSMSISSMEGLQFLGECFKALTVRSSSSSHGDSIGWFLIVVAVVRRITAAAAAACDGIIIIVVVVVVGIVIFPFACWSLINGTENTSITNDQNGFLVVTVIVVLFSLVLVVIVVVAAVVIERLVNSRIVPIPSMHWLRRRHGGGCI